LALHVLWDLPGGIGDAAEIQALAAKHGLRPGSINPNTFQDQIYKYGSLGNPDPEIRRTALEHIIDSIRIAGRLGCQDISLWFADGSNYPGTQNVRHRRRWFAEGLRAAHGHLSQDQRLLVEYKPFEPAFYHTDIADWGMALLHAQSSGPQAKVLVDTGHHYQGQNIE
jgi:L-rhamnose isomerase/sugar isomerase